MGNKKYSTKKKLSLSVIFFITFTLVFYGASSPTLGISGGDEDNDDLGKCTLNPKKDRTLVAFNGKRIRSDRQQLQATSGPVSISLKKGEYKVTLVSFDERSTNQPQESWHVILKNGSGGVVATSNAISDLPNGQDTLTEVVNNNLKVIQAVSSVTAFHAAFPNSNPNSVEPVCAAFDFIDDKDDKGPVCGNAKVETGEQCDDGNINDGDGCSSTCQLVSVDKKLDRRNIVHINSIAFDKEFVSPGDVLNIFLNFENQRDSDLKDARVTAIIQELGVRSRTMKAIVDHNDEVSKILSIEIPEYALPGRYWIEFVISMDGDRRIKYRPIDII